MNSSFAAAERIIQYESDENQTSMNVSIYDYPREIWVTLPPWEMLVKTIAFLPVISFGIFGNIALLCIVGTIRALKTPTNVLIANLAVVDLATLIVCPMMFMVHDFYQNYVMGAIGCKMEGFLEGSLLITSVLCLCAISYDRLTAIVFPKKSKLTFRGVWALIACTWIIGVLLALPLTIYRNYKERPWKNYLETFCAENTSFLPPYWHVLIGALVWFPLSVMIFCYSMIFLKLDRYERRVKQREHPIAVSYRKKVARSLFIVLVVFILLRVPFTTLVFIRYNRFVNENTSQIGKDFVILWYVSHYLIFLNAAVNPLIYGLTNDNFRKAYNKTRIWKCFWHSKTLKKLEPKREPVIMTIGQLQPRGPCGSEKLGDLSGWVIPAKPNNLNSPTEESRETKTSQLKPTTEDAQTKSNSVKVTSFYGCNLVLGDQCQNREVKPPSTLFI
ncbi:neuropeptide Y receptor type 2-like [Culex pipiens pallens]|uniref:neuropeptide Y receptor type 2-like n=1 Tax=Culex pipiens pallens TaxID=42434 RepID=UPI0019544B54|nr:neuropeptide Y receptor type 2-like [Culex pipiens pallens]